METRIRKKSWDSCQRQIRIGFQGPIRQFAPQRGAAVARRYAHFAFLRGSSQIPTVFRRLLTPTRDEKPHRNAKYAYLRYPLEGKLDDMVGKSLKKYPPKQ
jgi:hypothetical protein